MANSSLEQLQPSSGHSPSLRDMLLLAAIRPDRLVAVGWWRLLGKKLRAKYRLRDAIAALPFAYQRWLEAAGRSDLNIVRTSGSASFCIHIHLSNSDLRASRRVIASALRQSHEAKGGVLVTSNCADKFSLAHEWPGCKMLALCCDTPIQGLQAALREAQDRRVDYCILLREDTSLLRHAVAGYAAAAPHRNSSSALPILYSDQEEEWEFLPGLYRGRKAWLKPIWDPRMILSQDYLSAACAVPVRQTLAFLDSSEDQTPETVFELLLHLTQVPSPLTVRHVARVTTRTPEGDWHAHGSATCTAIAKVRCEVGQVRQGPFGTAALTYPEPASLPRISVLVATRDKVELLRACIGGLLQDTDYPSLEVIVVDNDSRQSETLAYMNRVSADARLRVVRWPHEFNYSAINNFAARHATGEYLCLLNNDVEVLHRDWLRAMLREAVRPGTGAVGARLLYPDQSIQHAGVVIGMGNAAGHAHRTIPQGDPGYFAQAHIARGASAVTAACLLVKKKYFNDVGGLDEDHLAVAYNDVDFCLKLVRQGLRNIYAPAATLIHHESKSRGLDFSPEHMERYLRELSVFQRRWSSASITDPWHHPRLDRAKEIYDTQFIT